MGLYSEWTEKWHYLIYFSRSLCRLYWEEMEVRQGEEATEETCSGPHEKHCCLRLGNKKDENWWGSAHTLHLYLTEFAWRDSIKDMGESGVQTDAKIFSLNN